MGFWRKMVSRGVAFGLSVTVSLGSFEGYTNLEEYAVLNSGEIVDFWAAKYGSAAVIHGLVNEGYPEDFREEMSREDFATLMVLVYESYTGVKLSVPHLVYFRDTDNDYVKKAYGLGLVSGYTAEEFAPQALVTRQEAAVMIEKLSFRMNLFGFSQITTFQDVIDSNRISAGIKMVMIQFLYYYQDVPDWEGALPYYSYETAYEFLPVVYRNLAVMNDYKYGDHGEISDWAEDSVYVAHSLGLMTGDEEKNFNPEDHIDVQSALVLGLRLIGWE